MARSKYQNLTLSMEPEVLKALNEICRDMSVSKSAFITMMVKYITIAEKVPFSRIMEMVLEDGFKGALRRVNKV